MDTIPSDLQVAASRAEQRLSLLGRRAVAAGAAPGDPALASDLAQAASGAIFLDALQGAIRARLAELKAVAK